MSNAAEIRGRAQAAVAAGERAAAGQAYADLASLEPSNKGVQTEAIEALFKIEDYARAQEVAAAALARFPTSPAVALGSVRALLALERRQEASDVLKGLCERKPELTEAWEKWGVVATMAGRFADAHLAYKGAAARRPADAALWNSLAEAALACGLTEDAESAWRASLRLDARQAVPAGQLGRLLMKRGALDEAAHWLRTSIACDPTLVPAHINLATVLLRQKRRPEALASAEQAVRLAPGRAEGHTTLGHVLLDLGWSDAAAAAFEKALGTEPTNTEALFGLANAHARAERFDDAVAATDRYLAVRPDDGQALHMRRVWARDGAKSSPDDYVRRLFDAVAGDFENHLQGNLSYDAPEQSAAMLAARYPEKYRFRSLCDVGCGTGLMAKALAPRFAIKEQVGIDLAPNMLEQARAKGFYSELIAGEAVATLAGMKRTFNLITAMDVLIYMGDGTPFLREAAKRLAPGGVLALSLETADDIADVRLERTTRFAHNKAHFIGLAADQGLACVKDEDVALRRESGADVRGCILIFERT